MLVISFSAPELQGEFSYLYLNFPDRGKTQMSLPWDFFLSTTFMKMSSVVEKDENCSK